MPWKITTHPSDLQIRAASLQELVYKQGQAGINKATVSITFRNDDPTKSPQGYEDKERITITRQVDTKHGPCACDMLLLCTRDADRCLAVIYNVIEFEQWKTARAAYVHVTVDKRKTHTLSPTPILGHDKCPMAGWLQLTFVCFGRVCLADADCDWGPQQVHDQRSSCNGKVSELYMPGRCNV